MLLVQVVLGDATILAIGADFVKKRRNKRLPVWAMHVILSTNDQCEEGCKYL